MNSLTPKCTDVQIHIHTKYANKQNNHNQKAIYRENRKQFKHTYMAKLLFVTPKYIKSVEYRYFEYRLNHQDSVVRCGFVYILCTSEISSVLCLIIVNFRDYV